MGLSPGTRLGPYEIGAQIGVGGMGEVYRATDTNLKRAVAIKVLPDAVAADPERLARFQREAEVLASLNHPNIAAIHGLERSAAATALVMELVEGPTLADRIAQRPVPVDEALPIARQIAEGLEAAHERGIIHRDLKPANIKLRSDGAVKVLDFGLAKALALDTASASSALANSPTITSPTGVTGVGVLLGTAAYMAPEQARGRAVDKRADIWAFGCVLYELLTGRRAFMGEDVPETLAAVIGVEPDWNALPAGLPAGVRRLLRRCLRRDPKERIHDISDARIELQELQAEVASSPAVSPEVGVTRRRERVVWAAASLLAVGSAFAIAVAISPRTMPGTPEMRVEIVTPPTSNQSHFAISPDGTRLAFVASGDGRPRVWVRALDSTEAQPLIGTENAMHPFWSPDGRAIGFFAGEQLKRVDLAGGAPQTLTKVSVGIGGAWSPDGTILFAAAITSPLMRVSAAGGNPTAVTRINPGHIGHRLPRFLPDGRRFLFSVYGNPDTQGIYIGSLDGGEPRRLVASDSAAAAWAAPGWMLLVRQGALVALPFDVDRGVSIEQAVTVADSVESFSVSATGLIAYRARGAQRRQLTWYGRDGTRVGTAGGPDENGIIWPELSPDGRRIAVARGIQGGRDVWLIDLMRGGTTRLTFDASENGAPVWSHDGTRIVFPSARKGTLDLYVKASTGAGAEELLRESTNPKIPLSWSSDGRLLLFYEVDPKTNFDLWTQPMTGDGTASPWLNTPFIETLGQFSPDGKWVAYQSNESGSFEIYVQPFPAANAKWQISTRGGTQPRWRPDGKELYFIAGDATLMAATVTAPATTFDVSPPVPLFKTGIVTANEMAKHHYTVSTDGRFVVTEPVEESTAAPISLILNWKAPH
jgi:serine/threonine protein kinase/Tol biopolymer transport system component